MKFLIIILAAVAAVICLMCLGLGFAALEEICKREVIDKMRWKKRRAWQRNQTKLYE